MLRELISSLCLDHSRGRDHWPHSCSWQSVSSTQGLTKSHRLFTRSLKLQDTKVTLPSAGVGKHPVHHASKWLQVAADLVPWMDQTCGLYLTKWLWPLVERLLLREMLVAWTSSSFATATRPASVGRVMCQRSLELSFTCCLIARKSREVKSSLSS